MARAAETPCRSRLTCAPLVERGARSTSRSAIVRARYAQPLDSLALQFLAGQVLDRAEPSGYMGTARRTR